MITCCDEVFKPIIHLQCPVISVTGSFHFIPCHHTQVVHHIAASNLSTPFFLTRIILWQDHNDIVALWVINTYCNTGCLLLDTCALLQSRCHDRGPSRGPVHLAEWINEAVSFAKTALPELCIVHQKVLVEIRQNHEWSLGNPWL